MKEFILKKLIPLLFWLAVWQVASVLAGSELIISSPLRVIGALITHLKDLTFYRDVLNSLFRVTAGYILSIAVGVLLAFASFSSDPIRALLSPLMAAVAATPVAAFIIVALLIFGSSDISAFISFLISLPIIYGNTLDGLRSVSDDDLKPAKLFGMRYATRMRYIHIPAAVPYFLSGSSVALGLAWKAGVAAEVIAITRYSLGERLYDAKLFLDMSSVFAYAVVIIAVSWLSEKLIGKALKSICSHLL